MSEFFLPDDYCPNNPLDNASEKYWTPKRIRMSGRFQSHIYKLASNLARREHAVRIADLGCGPATKLLKFFGSEYELHGFDKAEAVSLCRKLHSRGHFHAIDFENPNCGFEQFEKFDFIICADVIEHLGNPTHLLKAMKTLSTNETTTLISTPERNRLYGRHVTSPSNPAHVQEWSASELKMLLSSSGFDVVELRFFPAMNSGLDWYTVIQTFRRLVGSDRANPSQAAICKSIGNRSRD